MLIPYNNAYNQGKEIYYLENKIKKTKKLIDELIDVNHGLIDERQLVENKLINAKLTKYERAQFIGRIREMEAEKQKNIDEIKHHDDLLPELISEVEYLKKKYNHYEY